MEHKKHISLFLSSGCLSRAGLSAYIEGGLGEKEKAAIESHIHFCGFCRDALQGYLAVGNSVLVNRTLEDINRRVVENVRERRQYQAFPYSVSRGTRWAWVSVAASLLIAGLFSFYFIQMNRLPYTDVAEGYVPVREDKMPAYPLPRPTIPMETWAGTEESEAHSLPSVVEEPWDDAISLVEEQSLATVIPAESTESRLPYGANSPAIATTEKAKSDIHSIDSSLTQKAAGTAIPAVEREEALQVAEYSVPLGAVTAAKTASNAAMPLTTSASVPMRNELFVIESIYPNTVEPRPIYTIVESMPSFPGGADGMRAFFRQALQVPQGIPDSIRGQTIYIEAVIDDYGKARRPRVIEGLEASVDREAVKAVRKMPRWKPGKQNGQTVLVRVTIPVDVPVVKP